MAQQLTDASRASSQEMVSTVVGHSLPASSVPCAASEALPFPSPNHQTIHYSHSCSYKNFSNMFCVLVKHFKQSTISIKDSSLILCVIHHTLSVFSGHCSTALSSSFSFTNTGLYPIQFSIFFFFFCFPLNPSVLRSPHLTHLSILHRLPWPPVEDCTVSMAVL